MENVILVVHLLLALSLIGAVLLQRSEGGGLGIGGGGGGAMTGRSAATALGKLTWLLAIGFICTSIALTILAAREAGNSSVVDGAGTAPVEQGTTEGELLLPPSAAEVEEPLLPDAN